MAKAVGRAIDTRKTKRKEKTNTDNVEQEEEPNEGLAPEGFDENENLLNMKIPPLPELIMSADGAGQRLIISHIKVENFKSYYGKQTIGPFHKNFTAIIGPNGSGKSNVIDSLLFVFGYRASRIRSKKISVLIHSSAGRDNITNCTVAVYFKQVIDVGRDEMRVVEGSEFFVSRTAYRDNSSRYTLNGITTQFKDIAKVLRSSGIDLIHNRFLILQGEVEQISLMKPKAQNENEEGMLEYLEDIIGSSRLKLPINKLLFKLGKLQELRASQMLRLRHAEKDKLSLEEPAKLVILKLRVENAITIVHSKILSIKKLAMSDEITELAPEHKHLLEELDEAQKKVNELTSHLQNIKGDQKKLQRTLEKKQETLAKASSDLSEGKQIVTKIENDRKRLNDQQEKLISEIAKEKTKISDLKSIPEKAQIKLAKFKSDLEKAEKAIQINCKAIESKLPIVKEKTETLRESHKKLDSELGKHILVEDEVARNLALFQEEMSNLQREEITQRRILADLRDSTAHVEEELTTKTTNLKKAEKNLPTLENSVESLRCEQLALSKEEAKLDDYVRTLRIEVENHRQLSEKFHGANRLIKALMEQKQSGWIKGLFGRLGDLGAIDKKYDIAISTTCGALDNIVVDCVETAQLCIKFLQRENLGVASFIALDKQQHYLSRMRNKPKIPENALRLFDLIQVTDEKVLPAFYYALNDTLVADDITLATKIAMSGGQRWRTVTLKGEVVEISGAMTGGGNSQKKGKIGQQVKVNTSENSEAESGKNLSALCSELESEEAKLTETRQKLAQIQKNYRDRQIDLKRASALVKNLHVDVEILAKNIDSLNEQLVCQKEKLNKVTVNPSLLKEYSDKIEKLKTESDKIATITDSLRIKLINLTEKIDNVNDDIIGVYQKALRNAETEKASLEKAISKENNSIMSNERNINKAKARKFDLKSDLTQVETKLNELDALTAEAEESLIVLKEKVEIEKAQVTEAESVCNESVKLVKELNSDELELVKRVTHFQNETDRVYARLCHSRAQIINIDIQVKKLKLFRLDHLPLNLLNNEDEDLQNLLMDNLNVENEEQDSDDDKLMEPKPMDVPCSSCSSIEDMNVEGELKKSNTQENEIANQLGKSFKVPFYTEDEIRSFEASVLDKQLKALQERKENNKKTNVNYRLLMDYLQRMKIFDAETKQFQNISKQRDLHRDFCERLKKQRLQEFMEGFQIIGERLKDMYQMITLGGDASLDLVDSLDPFSEGVSFGVRPPKKSWKQITNLSGGEKTLASLALVFGLHHYRPTPLYVMDEIDAALDFRNVSIISSYILERTKNAQFIVISLRNNMFERGDRLVGIYKIFDCTYNVVLDPKAAEKILKKNLKALKFERQKLISQKTSLVIRTAEKMTKHFIQIPLFSFSDANAAGSGLKPPKRRLFDKEFSSK